MKKMLMLFGVLLLGTAAVQAQTVTEATIESYDSTSNTETKTKVKPKTTVKDKAYNLVHRKKKRSSGVKTKTTTETRKIEDQH
ncbi:hypothetical protein [Flaviaesturariibacter amylovorans]|uniref:Uncharacterized protein n=1 Tax=Flaviaesturariibacter amylovorans TaxID=1084520 RepID=A0ABP8GXN4_9BACT